MEIWKLHMDGLDAAYFTTFDDIESSLRTSYSSCKALDIVKSPAPHGGPTFTVTGQTDYGTEAFKHVYKTERLFVHDRATHL